MDADFTHQPDKVRNLLEDTPKTAVVVGSRFLESESLENWSLFRKFLTKTAHFLTRLILGIEVDATNAFRLYRLEELPRGFDQWVESNGYSFFFESLYQLKRRGYSMGEIPLTLSKRAQGDSKMTLGEVFKSVKMLLALRFRS